MGMIADELDRSLAPLQGIMGLKTPMIVPGTSFSTPAGPVMGVASLEMTTIYLQLDELTKTVGKLSKAIRKLEDTKKP